MRLQTPIAQVHGLGPSRGAMKHWWVQRLTAVALIPLGLWFVASLAAHAGDGPAAFSAWMSRPWVAALHIMFIGSTFYHAQIGVQIVVEDYVQNEFTKITTLVCVKLAAVLLSIACLLAVVRVAAGG